MIRTTLPTRPLVPGLGEGDREAPQCFEIGGGFPERRVFEIRVAVMAEAKRLRHDVAQQDLELSDGGEASLAQRCVAFVDAQKSAVRSFPGGTANWRARPAAYRPLVREMRSRS
jgi:hypothetical protein